MENLPYLTAALICESVLQEKDETLSAIRIVDRLRLQTFTFRQKNQTTEAAPSDASPAPIVKLAGLVCLKKGKSEGTFALSIEAVSPANKRTKLFDANLELKGGEESGQNVNLTLIMSPQEVGLYWFDVLLNGHLLSRIPLTIELLPPQPVGES